MAKILQRHRNLFPISTVVCIGPPEIDEGPEGKSAPGPFAATLAQGSVLGERANDSFVLLESGFQLGSSRGTSIG